MSAVVTAIAQVLALESEANFTAIPGVAYDSTDAALRILADALLQKMNGAGIDLLALYRRDTILVAAIDDRAAEEPLCPFAFRQVVRQLSYRLLGEVWDGVLLADTPAQPLSTCAEGAIELTLTSRSHE